MGQRPRRASLITCLNALVESLPWLGLRSGASSMSLTLGVETYQLVMSVGAITLARFWVCSSPTFSYNALVCLLERLPDPYEFSLVAPPPYRRRRALIGG